MRKIEQLALEKSIAKLKGLILFFISLASCKGCFVPDMDAVRQLGVSLPQQTDAAAGANAAAVVEGTQRQSDRRLIFVHLPCGRILRAKLRRQQRVAVAAALAAAVAAHAAEAAQAAEAVERWRPRHTRRLWRAGDAGHGLRLGSHSLY